MKNTKFSATDDTSKLVETTGYWSGDTIYFNQQSHDFIITNDQISVDNLHDIIDNYLSEYDSASGTTRFDREINIRINNKSTPFPHSFTENAVVRDFYALKHILKENKSHPELSELKISSWGDFYAWLKSQRKTHHEQKSLFSSIIFHSYRNTTDSSPFAYIRGLLLLFHPWLQFNIAHWSRQHFTMKDIITIISNNDHNNTLNLNRKSITCTPDFYHLVESATHGGIVIPDHFTPGNNHARVWYRFRTSLQMLLGLLYSRGYLLFPPCYTSSECWHGNDIFYQRVHQLWPENWKWHRSDHQVLGYRLVSSSTLNSLHDIPVNIYELINNAYGAYGKYTDALLTKRLKQFQSAEGITAFPLTKLNGLKARRNSLPPKWSYEWCVQLPELTAEWITFAKIIKDNRSHTVEREVGILRATLEWAWFARHFMSPLAITTEDLRDPNNPDRTDTLYAFIKEKNVSGWDMWNKIELAFRIVTLHSKFSVESPFRAIENPFRTNKRKTGLTTTRQRIPNNIHAAMLHILLSPDEDGNPTYSLAKEVLKNDWIQVQDPETHKKEWVFCPSRTYLLALLLILPLRKKQASWLDQGLLDPCIWDIGSNQYIRNTHHLREKKYPSGQSHIGYNGRPTGVLQPVTNDWFPDKTCCIYVNTNKTQMWDPDNRRGYELWWPTSDSLTPDIDIADLTQQKKYLNRPYEIIKEQIKWLQQYDPNPEPITFTDWSDEKMTRRDNDDIELPFFTPIFRDVSSPFYRDNGQPYYTPPTKTKLRYLLNVIAVHAEKDLKKSMVRIYISPEKTQQI